MTTKQKDGKMGKNRNGRRDKMTSENPLTVVRGFFLFMIPTTYDKPFKTYDQMLEIMRNRHIIIQDPDFAKMALENFSYYSLVNGYKNTFLQIPKTDNFIDGTHFEELYTLHVIDISLNNILFKYILYIEKSLKSRISYLVSEKFGVYTDRADMSNNNPNDYLYNKNYSSSTNKRDPILRKLKECTQNHRNNPSLAHYIMTKNHLPAWVLVNNVPFGLAIEWYSILTGIHKTEICSRFINTAALTTSEKKEFFQKALSLVKDYRNQIAHGNRTFSIMQLPVLPKKQLLNLSMGILSEDEYDNRHGQNDIFAVVMVILLLINDQYLLTNFYRDFLSIFEPYKNTKFNEKTIYEVFNLPNDIADRLSKLLKARFT